MIVSERLHLRTLSMGDAPFILRLVNDPDWLKYIGDKHVHNLNEAKEYIENGPHLMQAKHGVSLLLVETLAHGVPIGLCGLLKRDSLECPDLGFAFLTDHRGHGFAFEASQAVLNYAKTQLKLPKVAAITALDNISSISLLEKLGFNFSELIKLDRDDPGTRLFFLPF
ncbi:MAG: ribosomal-protein-alanine N-acetyltransferase [Paraglaciecola sp.]|jgi:ribosomal-protein-alanine N-acetyltransferase